MRRRKFTRNERSLIAERAGECCEYCQAPLDFSPETFEVEHIVPLKKGGSNELENLAYSCGGCNNRKRDRTTGHDPIAKKEVQLFNPRTDSWNEHFGWSSDCSTIEGKTQIGRATVETLGLNRKGLVNLRFALIRYGVHPK